MNGQEGFWAPDAKNNHLVAVWNSQSRGQSKFVLQNFWFRNLMLLLRGELCRCRTLEGKAPAEAEPGSHGAEKLCLPCPHFS